MSNEIDPSRETLVFPSRTVSRQYQKYFMKTRRLNAVDGSRFIEWDRFTEKLRRVPDGEFRSIKPIMRRLFTEMLIEENISRPFLNYLIPAPAAAKSRSYRGILNQALLYFSGNNSERKPPAAGGHLLSGRCFLRCIGLRNNRFTNCTELGYGVFNEIRAAESIRLTTDRTILLNARTFPESPGMKNTVLYLHPNKRTVVRNRHWGGVLWKEVLFDEN